MCSANKILEFESAPKDSDFYNKAKEYWSNIPPTEDGVLGGFGHISSFDIKGSRKFLETLFKHTEFPPGKERALDCGAGIGRISQRLLTGIFKKVDLVEINKSFLDQAKQTLEKTGRLGDLYCCGLQEFVPEHKYDIIWIQWVLGHLTDEHLVEFFNTCQECLNPSGMIVVKENLTNGTEVDQDLIDSSVTRPLNLWHKIFERSGLVIIKSERQTNFPKGLYPVRMFALRSHDKV